MVMLLNVMSHHPKTFTNPKGLSAFLVEPWSKKMRSPNPSALGPLARDLSGLELHFWSNCGPKR